jgi:ubiquitin C-terminal hydrolase
MKGLPNVGNTCYFNAALQCLFQVPPLTNYFLKLESSGQESEFVTEYRRLIRQYWSDDTGMIDPRLLLWCFVKRYRQFDNHDQQDAHEVVTCMLDLFDQSVVKHIFGGQVTQETLCPSGKSVLTETCYAIVLYPTGSCRSMAQALEDHQKYETIPEYVDGSGKKHHVSVSRTVITSVPRILIVSFQGRRLVSVSHELRIGSVTKSLFALICHVGNEFGGHYVAFTKHMDTWYYKNDHHVTTVGDPPDQAFYSLAMYK